MTNSNALVASERQDISVLANVDARTRLAGSNKMEILLFSLGTREIFGINVFKVREVSQTPDITKSPNMPFGVQGVISLRGNIIPIISLGKFIGAEAEKEYNSMIVTEFSKSTQAFLVESVDRIIRVDWDKMKAPENVINNNGSNVSQAMITAITELDDGKLVSILDVEQILASVIGEPHIPDLPTPGGMKENQFVFFADDSFVARKEITAMLDKMKVKYHQANNGREAWEKLRAVASRPVGNMPLSASLKVILVDAEMPEMDGYVLTRNIKSDKRFQGIPVVMHSSLSSDANKAMGASVGVDAYVAKFEPALLAETIMPYLQR